MRLFGSDRIARLMDRLGAEEGEVLTHALITRSIEQAQKRVELQNFQARKRLLEYDDVMNQQREVIYSLRSFALEGGEELKGEALKMVEKAAAKRVEMQLAEFEDAGDWDLALVRQDLLMHYLLTVPQLESEDITRTIEAVRDAAVEAGRKAFFAKIESLDSIKDEQTEQGFADRLLSLVMLNVLDEKWKDHLYDLDQLRNAIHYRSWGQKDPLIEYKQEAYTMFVDLMSDIHHTFTERFLRAQIVFQPPEPVAAPVREALRPTKRYNALGILEDIPPEERVPSAAAAGDGQTAEEPDGGAEPERAGGEAQPKAAPTGTATPRGQATVVGAGRTRSLTPSSTPGGNGSTDFSNVGRNDPCPCGSGRKFKKCHGANL
jgi:preprotein translocase subunit SecA